MSRSPYSPLVTYLYDILPGLLFCAAIGAAAIVLDRFLLLDRVVFVNYVLIAILLGFLARNVMELPSVLDAGISFSARICLFIGIVLLGARLDLREVFSVGTSALILVGLSILLTLVLAIWMGRLLRVTPQCSHLLGVGLGICGISAIVATAPAIRAKDTEMVGAIGASILTDLIVLISFPIIANALSWSDLPAGFMAGIIPSNTAQCIAVGYSFSDGAGAIATIVKSARNALMPLVILGIVYRFTLQGLPTGQSMHPQILWDKFPKFIVGFLAAAFLATFNLISPATISLAGYLSQAFFVVCFAGIGAGIRLEDIAGKNMRITGLIVPILVIRWLFIYAIWVLLPF